MSFLIFRQSLEMGRNHRDDAATHALDPLSPHHISPLLFWKFDPKAGCFVRDIICGSDAYVDGIGAVEDAGQAVISMSSHLRRLCGVAAAFAPAAGGGDVYEFIIDAATPSSLAVTSRTLTVGQVPVSDEMPDACMQNSFIRKL
jgi:hypothetical protein